MDTGVYGAAVAKVWLMDGADDVRIFLLILICDLCSSVLGTVIDYKNLYFVSSRKKRLDTLLHISFGIVAWNCYTK